MKQFLIILIVVICVFAQISFASAELKYHSRVVSVTDGNTLVVSNRIMRGNISMTIDAPVVLDGVKAPRLDQPGGEDARSFLEGLLKDKDIFVVERIDGGKSRGAWVFVGDEKKSVNVLLVEEGKAWLIEPRSVYESKTKKEHIKMKDAFLKAKEQKKGIWADENPIPPWEWIKQHPKKDEAQPAE